MERRWLWGIMLVMLLAITLPYGWAALVVRQDMRYTGILYNPDDQNVHLAWARQAMHGSFFFRDLFTTESLTSGERPLYNNVFCFALGLLAALSHVPLIWLYHLLRVLFAACALYWFYRLCAVLTDDRRVRLVALTLAALSSGTGWLVPLAPGLVKRIIFIDRPDLSFPMMPEAFTFSSAFIFPLFIAAISLLPLIYLGVLQAQRTGRLRYAVGAGLATLVLGNIHTYDALPLSLTLLLWALYSYLAYWRKPDGATATRSSWLAPLMVVMFALVPVFLQWLVFRGSKEFSTKALTQTAPPPLFDVLFSYGPLFVLAVAGAVASWPQRTTRLMTLWVVVTLGIIYVPTSILSFARKMIEGVHLPLCFLAASGLVWLVSYVPQRALRGIIVAGVVAVSCISSVQFIGWCLGNAWDNNYTRGQTTTSSGVPMPPLYLTIGDASALDFLAQRSISEPPTRAVLCLPFIGNYVPRATGLYVYIGHWAETMNYMGKFGEAARFYTGKMSPEEAHALLRENHIGFVLEGFFEKAFASETHAPLPSQLYHFGPPVFSAHGTSLYAVDSQ